MRGTVLPVFLAVLACRVESQTSPFLDPALERALRNELSGDVAFENLRILTQWHRPSASEGFFAAARFIEAKAKEYGLEDVRWIDQVAHERAWSCRRAEAWLIEGEGADAIETKLGSYQEVAVSIADNSRSADVTAELIDVGDGEDDDDYAGKQVGGLVVLASGASAKVMEQAVWKRGAAGILSWASSRLEPLGEAGDQIAWQHVQAEDGPKGEATSFAFVISPRAGAALSARLKGEKPRHIFATGEPKAESLRVRIVVEAEFGPKQTAMVEARIRGTDPSLPEVVLTSHLQEEKTSANDDGSGVVSMLEIGRTLTRLIAEGKLARPRRGIRFWWCDEIYSEYRYFADHPEERARVLCNLNQDMVGARQSLGGRVQQLARTPWSRPSFLSDVVESILDAVVAGNQGYLNVLQGGKNAPRTPFSKPIFAPRGSREPYHARAVPYYDSTDHLVFNDAWVGVPGISLTNWPDEYIHSTADDLWQVDATQLERNAFVIAASSWWIANAGPEALAGLRAHLHGRALERLGRLFTVAAQLAGDGSAAGARAARNLLEVGFAREQATLASASFAGPASAASADDHAGALERAGQELLKALDRLAPVGREALEPEEVERRLASKVPRKAVASLAEWMELERSVERKREAEQREKRERKERELAAGTTSQPSGGEPEDDEGPELHRQMQVEVMNLIDGSRDAAAIARFVLAEAAAAGPWYYGEVSFEMVEKFLEKQAKDGLIVW